MSQFHSIWCCFKNHRGRNEETNSFFSYEYCILCLVTPCGIVNTHFCNTSPFCFLSSFHSFTSSITYYLFLFCFFTQTQPHRDAVSQWACIPADRWWQSCGNWVSFLVCLIYCLSFFHISISISVLKSISSQAVMVFCMGFLKIYFHMHSQFTNV